MSHDSATLHVVVPLPMGNGYDYAPATKSERPLPGSLVEVPLGQRHVIGVVWGDGQGDVDPRKIKPITRCLDLPGLSAPLRNFVDWVADYTLTPRGAVLKMVLGNSNRLSLKKGDGLTLPPSPHSARAPTLSPAQHEAASQLTSCLGQGFTTTLLDGVTGSGKTEVFTEAIRACLTTFHHQALLLLPEIAMTAALFGRLEALLGITPVEWHSHLTERQRRINWHRIATGEARFIIGARSALFLPFAHLGLIVVDEEHEAAYKQEEGVIYHARDMAVVRGRTENVPVILASATPSLETMTNVHNGKYGHVTLPQRYGDAKLPTLSMIDLREQSLTSQQFLSPPLINALTDTLSKGQQGMLYLNRRGYAPLTLCRACGHRMQCPQCTSWLIEHRSSGNLHCHHCDYRQKLPPQCPSCNAEGKFAACGPGVERVVEEVQSRLPQARVAMMTSDSLNDQKAAHAIVDGMLSHTIDILVGTQIMAKGYHFPNLTFVGVVDADLGLAGGDPRAAERTYQVLQQVAGRSGRSAIAGHVMLQTTNPDNPVLKALMAGKRDDFMAAELTERAAYHLPPFARLAHLTFAGPDSHQTLAIAEMVAKHAPQIEGIRILGPAPTPFTKLRGRYRYRLLIQGPRHVHLSRIIRAWLAPLTIPRSLRLHIDIDPYSFL